VLRGSGSRTSVARRCRGRHGVERVAGSTWVAVG
jgi:hypothetical protein